MIDYVYTNEFPEVDIKDQDNCTHEEHFEHSCKDQKCYLWRLAFAIDLHKMGDKYDIQGLRTCFCKYLDQTYNSHLTSSWVEDIELFDVVYQNSRANDDLRKWLNDTVNKYLANSDCFLSRRADFHAFLERSSELVVYLFKQLLERERK